MRILYITSTRIGDAVLGSGALAYLVERYPNARFTVACGPIAAPLFANVPRLERLISVPKKKYGLHWLILWSKLVTKPWYMVVDMRSSATAWLLPTLHRRILSPIKTREHRVVRFSKVVSDAGPLAPHIFAGPDAFARAEAIVPRSDVTLALAPTANWFGKQWPIERFIELAQRLTGPGGMMEGAPVLVLGGPGERTMAEPLLESLPAERTTALFGDVDLLTAYACLTRCRLFVGNDSGLMHLAAAAGISTLGLFGPSRETLYGPWGPHGRSLRGASVRQIFDENFDRHARRTYMTSIEVDAVLAAAQDMLAEEHRKMVASS